MYCIVLFLGGSVVRGEDSNLAQFLESQRVPEADINRVL